MDPAEVRRTNFIPKDAFPHTTVSHAAYDSGDYEGALDLALRSAGYDELRAEQRRRREQGAAKELGIGLSSYVGDHQRPRRERVRRGRDHRGRRRDRPHRLVLPRAGTRDHVRDDRRRAARASARAGHRPQGRHGRRSPGNRHLRLQVHPDRRHGCQGRGGRGRRAREGARRRLPRGERGRHRARPGAGPVPCRRIARAGADLGGARLARRR